MSDDPKTAEAVAWLRPQSIPPRQVVPALAERFGLTPVQACEVIALARGLPVRRAADAA
jgi:hypothetical protein